MDITYALQSLRPGSEWSLNGNTYDGLIWYNSNELPPPTEEEVLVEVERLKQDWKNNQYQRERCSCISFNTRSIGYFISSRL